MGWLSWGQKSREVNWSDPAVTSFTFPAGDECVKITVKGGMRFGLYLTRRHDGAYVLELRPIYEEAR